MDCARFAEALFEQLEGNLDAAGSEPMRAHASSCRACRELQAAALRGRTAAVEPIGLTASILAATSGSACIRAQHLSATRAGAALYEVDEALELHLENCPECRTLARALERLQRQLPLWAEVLPGGDFVDEVMAATTRAPQQRSLWDRFVRRPRLALEGAYAGTLALFLVVGFPGAPLAEVPARLLTGLGQQGADVRHAVTAGTLELAAAGRRTWTESGHWLATYIDVCESPARAPTDLADIAQCWRRASEERIARSWRDHVEPAIESLHRLRRRALGLIDSGGPTREHDDGRIGTSV